MATYYVATTGNDTNAGTSGSPWRTIGYADSVVVAGDTVNVLPGVYPQTDAVQFITAASGTSTAPITYRSTVLYGAKVTNTNTAFVWQHTGNWTTISGFEVTSSTNTTRLGIYMNGNNCTVKNCHIHDLGAIGSGVLGGAGIDFANATYTSTNNNAIANRVHDIGYASGTNGVHGIYFSCNGGNCFNNKCYRNGAFGIHLWHGATNINIFNNLGFGNLYGGVVVGAAVGEGAGLDDFTIVANNIFIYNGQTGINGTGIDETGSTGTHNQYINNVVWNNIGLSQIALQNGLTATGTINADPQLVNYQADGSGNYRLQAGSPCINAGIASGAPGNDFDGIARPQGAGYDIGPYEYLSGGPTFSMVNV